VECVPTSSSGELHGEDWDPVGLLRAKTVPDAVKNGPRTCATEPPMPLTQAGVRHSSSTRGRWLAPLPSSRPVRGRARRNARSIDPFADGTGAQLDSTKDQCPSSWVPCGDCSENTPTRDSPCRRSPPCCREIMGLMCQRQTAWRSWRRWQYSQRWPARSRTS
jgi:hypothetical protein